jgi:hypothetical protein
MMEFDKIVNKRLKGMAVRILSFIEDSLDASDLEDVGEEEAFTITGGSLREIRSEILNAAGETSRSIASLKATPAGGVSKVSFSREAISALGRAVVEIAEAEGSNEKMPVFETNGDFNLLHKIRNDLGVGVVYNKKYICRGVEDIVGSLIPLLDSASLAGIKIAGGDYKTWRDAVCELYLEGLGDE